MLENPAGRRQSRRCVPRHFAVLPAEGDRLAQTDIPSVGKDLQNKRRIVQSFDFSISTSTFVDIAAGECIKSSSEKYNRKRLFSSTVRINLSTKSSSYKNCSPRLARVDFAGAPVPTGVLLAGIPRQHRLAGAARVAYPPLYDAETRRAAQ